MQVGDIGWIIRPSCEAANYGQEQPVLPWEVKVTKVYPENNAYRVQAFNADTGKVDDDPNATAVVGDKEFFFAKSDAEQFYLCKMLVYVNQQLCDLAEVTANLSKLVQVTRGAGLQ